MITLHSQLALPLRQERALKKSQEVQYSASDQGTCQDPESQCHGKQ